MEGRINQKIDTYIQDFKDNVINLVRQQELEQQSMDNIIQYVYDYTKYKVGKEDLVKRKRVKNTVPLFDRCCAKRANGEQCTRRKKESFDYCGTHEKGRPHGIVTNDPDGNNETKQIKREIWAQEIRGIIYYIDKEGNVYQTEDVMNNQINPKVIAQYNCKMGVYSIPEFNI
jgi:hypothetical protein